ncbi:TfoX/Sxy family protein [Chitinophaga arvensicola]|uniref:Transcriptional regulator of competence genes, TfoX/Sxy family n=1 Tax=Chitinophaga arvensicola TaxID=29529 RepID=A0A1I0RLV6_9BACT|nr:TfoX/Sxy family protein [Chitinophaga arvensicola]SEW42069.1 Transcriptional regulator of competence genes, TfoX/Sxy family [Chitinophaga arvensicola]
MAYNEKLADRVREILSAATDAITEKKMFGGLCFMVHDKMCVGVRPDKIMVRIDPDKSEEILESATGAEPMVHGGRLMKGFIYIDEAELHTKKQLQHWIKMALDFNAIAKPSKKK